MGNILTVYVVVNQVLDIEGKSLDLLRYPSASIHQYTISDINFMYYYAVTDVVQAQLIILLNIANNYILVHKE